jgi:putative ABC transport system permease protein
MTLAGLAARNVFRNKFRVVLTILGVAVAMLTFVMLRTVMFAWTSGADYAAKDRVVTRHKVTFVMTLPKRYVDDIRNAKGAGGAPLVQTATFANWFGGKDPKHDKEFFGTLAVDSATYFDVYGEISVPPDQMAAWKADRNGAIVGDVLAKKMGWVVGSIVTLETGIYPNEPDKPWTFTVAAIYTTTAKSVDRSSFLFHWERLNDAVPLRRQDQIGWIVARTTDSAHAADAGLAIDKLFDDHDTQTVSQDERSFNTSFLASISAVLKALDIVSVAILAIMMLILGNTIAMGVRERTNEYGVLRAIGFLPRHIALFILGESVIISMLGGVVGLLISYPIVEQGMGRWLEENMGNFFPYFRIAPMTAVAALVIAVILGIVAAGVPALQASRLKVTDALRRVA